MKLCVFIELEVSIYHSWYKILIYITILNIKFAKTPLSLLLAL